MKLSYQKTTTNTNTITSYVLKLFLDIATLERKTKSS